MSSGPSSVAPAVALIDLDDDGVIDLDGGIPLMEMGTSAEPALEPFKSAKHARAVVLPKSGKVQRNAAFENRLQRIRDAQ